MAIPIRLTVNGKAVDAQVEPNTLLVQFLREQLRLTGTHVGCEHGVCGACTVIVDDAPVRSCLMFAAQAAGKKIRTVEGLADGVVDRRPDEHEEGPGEADRERPDQQRAAAVEQAATHQRAHAAAPGPE